MARERRRHLFSAQNESCGMLSKSVPVTVIQLLILVQQATPRPLPLACCVNYSKLTNSFVVLVGF